MYEDWSRQEVDVIVADHLEMLEEELAGRSFNKAEHNRDLRRQLGNRSRGSIEFKHANISAVLIALGYPYIDGYKPRRNYQDLLRASVAEQLSRSPHLSRAAAAAVNSPVAVPTNRLDDWQAVLVDPPAGEAPVRATRERPGMPPTFVRA